MAISQQPREACIRALAAAQGIPDVAFELLLTGNIPDVPLGALGGSDGEAVPDEGYGDEDMGEEGDVGEGGDPLAQYNLDPATLQAIQTLVSNPSFPMIRQRMV